MGYRLFRSMLAAMAAFTAVALAGCGGFSSASAPAAPAQGSLTGLKGVLHGGQNPIAYASLQVYEAGTTGGYGTGATALIPTANPSCTAGQSPTCYYAGGEKGCVASASQTCYTSIVSDGTGAFNITGDYSCTLGKNLYLTATGGNPGGGTNNASVLMAGFGLCDNLANVPDLLVNEVTTVGTVWALAPFMSDSYNAATQAGSVNIGAPATNVAGLNQAFADINTLVNYVNGMSPGPAPGSQAVVPTGTTVPSQEIYAIADALAACVNTTGGGACTTLFGYTVINSVAPSDTVGAALNMANNPTANGNATNILQLGATKAPFVSNFAAANDLTLAVTYTGNGINAPNALAVDASGNVWIANSGGNSVTELAHNGTSVGASPFTAGAITAPTALAVDTNGNVWVANGNSTLSELSSTGSNVGSSPYAGGGLSGPTSVAIDGLGYIWIANSGNNSVSEFSSTGTAISGVAGYTAGGLSNPISIAINAH